MNGMPLGRYVNINFRRPSVGDPYCRCPICKGQVFARVVRSATFSQTVFTLRANLAQHIIERHPEDAPDPVEPEATTRAGGAHTES